MHAAPSPRRLGQSGLEVSALGLGGAGLGGAAYGPVSDAEAVAAVHAALGGGVTYIDTSPLYGESERRIGLALRDGVVPRDRVALSTKTGTRPALHGDYSAAATHVSVAESLRLLGVDYIDLVLVHDPPNLRQALGPGGAVEALEALKREGVIRAIGLGVRDHALHRAAIASGRVDVVLTYLDYTLLRTTAADDILPLAAARDVGVINGSPLAMGLLSGADPDAQQRAAPAWSRAAPREVARARQLWRWARARGVDLRALALQFSLCEPRIASTLVGAKTAAEVEGNLAAATTPLPEGIWDDLGSLDHSGKSVR